MTPLPLHHAEPFSSVWSVMHFPDDPEKARGLAARDLSGVLGVMVADGRPWSPSAQVEYLRSIAMGVPRQEEIQSRLTRGVEVGDIVSLLWGLICGNPEIASWDAAIQIAEDLAVEAGMPGSRSTFRDHLRLFSPVLHFWGAWAIRGRRLETEVMVGWPAPFLVDAFLMEAVLLHRGLTAWRDTRSHQGEPLISDRAFGPWEGWSPPGPEARPPGMGALAMYELSADLLPARRPPGRPRKSRPA